jgi:sugar O-acyltransferase (sialic acid O-acetyltransferase NeuD family)
MEDILIYGAGGFGREIACLLKAINEVEPIWNFIGFIDDGVKAGHDNRYGTVLGNRDFLNNYSKRVAVAISIASPSVLQMLVAKITNKNVWYPNIIAPNVRLFDPESVTLGEGNLIFFGCRLSCDVSIGNFNLFNGAVSLGHDVKMGDYNVLGPSTRISGDTKVGDQNFFGVQAIVLQGLNIGNNTRIGTNSVVMRNTKDNALYFGNPAKRVSV